VATMTTGRPVRWAPQANGPLMARLIASGLVDHRTEVQYIVLTWAFAVERVTGIEPALSAWEADVLPLNYTRASWHLPRVITAVPGLCCVRSDIVPDPVGCQGAPL
jgi:hypothetical protein